MHQLLPFTVVLASGDIYGPSNFKGQTILQGGECCKFVLWLKLWYGKYGCTIHSLLKLTVGSRANIGQSGQSLIKLQSTLKPINYGLTDEYSMLSQKTLGWIDKHCKQATTFLTDEPFMEHYVIKQGIITHTFHQNPLFHHTAVPHTLNSQTLLHPRHFLFHLKLTAMLNTLKGVKSNKHTLLE